MELHTNSKLFLVDDEPFHSALVEQQLNNLGYKNIHTFSSGTECLHHITANPDIIFLDYNMNGHSGFEVLTKIKRFDPNIFVVMLSGQENLEAAVSCLKYGAFDYIVKNSGMGKKIDSVLQRIAVIQQELEKENQPKWKKLIMTLI
jgi:polysaccharide export outer membrane protein